MHIYLNKHLQVRVRWGFNKKSTPVLFMSTRNQQLDFYHKEFRPKSFVNPRHIAEVIDKKLLQDITQSNLEQLGKLKLSKQLEKKKVKIT